MKGALTWRTMRNALLRTAAAAARPAAPQRREARRAARTCSPAALRTAAAGASSACGACLPLRCEINNKAVTNHSGQRGARGSESNDEC